MSLISVPYENARELPNRGDQQRKKDDDEDKKDKPKSEDERD